MKTRVGTDIVHIGEFYERYEKNRWKFKRDIFTKEEHGGDSTPEHLAGIFAAKEAAFKALGIGPENWLDVRVHKNELGKPFIIFSTNIGKKIKSSDLSISHSGDYAIAVVALNI